jgi:translocator assembly and maintenance protein 41
LYFVEWETLYVAGRLHKPVNVLEVDAGRQELDEALRSNLASAVSAALLGLPASFAERDLYLAIANISYTGDLR